jgi:sugar phosphate isomerase/epimerase
MRRMSRQPPIIFSTGSLYPLDVARCFELAAEAGFDGVEVMCDDRWSTRDPSYLARLARQSGQPIRAVHTPFSPSMMGWSDISDELDRVKHALKLAEKLGAGVLVVHLPMKVGRLMVRAGGRRLTLPWGNPFAPVKDWMENGGLAETQRGTPVRIAIENMPKIDWAWQENPVWWNEVAAWAGIHEHLTLDTTHWATFGIDPLAAYRAAGRHVAHVHLSNFDGREHRLPHRGSLDLGEFLRALAADGYPGTISLELHPAALSFSNERRLRRNLAASLAFCRHHLAAG